MKNAPNVKKLPKDLFTEAVIFAGSDAWSHAKGWEEGLGKQIAGDSIPPVYLGPKQLEELDHLRIVDDGRRAARVYLAGEIQPMKINDIGVKLARAGVQDAKLFPGHSGSRTGGLARLSQADQRRCQLRGSCCLYAVRWLYKSDSKG